MNKILIFTNSQKASSTRFYLNYRKSYPTAKHPFSHFSYVNGQATLQHVTTCSQDGIYLIHDGHNTNTDDYNKIFDALLEQCEGDDLYILVHSLPSRKADFEKLGFREPKEGRHESGEEFCYYPIFDILMDNKDEKMGRIIQLLKPLESVELLGIALKFFDGCLSAKNENEAFVDAKNTLVKDKEFGEYICEFYDNHYIKDGNFQEYIDYYQALRSVAEKVIVIIVGRIKKEKH